VAYETRHVQLGAPVDDSAVANEHVRPYLFYRNRYVLFSSIVLIIIVKDVEVVTYIVDRRSCHNEMRIFHFHALPGIASGA
jgi:hypothetical protein